MDELITVAANAVGEVRRDRFLGRDYLVAPATIIVPGVLNGSKGPLYYPPDEVSKNPGDWNRVPIVVYHPVVDGRNVSARSPKVLEKVQVGEVFNDTIGPNGTRRVEAWFDVERTKQVDRRVYDALAAGRPIELSTGLFTSDTPAPAGYKDHAGNPYSGLIARNYRPDHLAVLPDQVGACSLRDGCGVLVRNADGLPIDELDAALAFVLDALDPDPTDNFGTAFRVEPSHGLDMTPEKACLIIKERIVNGHKLTKKQRGLFGAKCGERDRPKANADADATTPEPTTVPVTNQGGTAVALTAEQRKQIVDGLVTNCGCAGPRPWAESDRETLNKFPDEKLMTMDECRKKMAANEATVNGLVTNGVLNADGTVKRVDAKPALTPEQEEDLAFARTERQRQKAAVANRLVANTTGDEAAKRARFDKLMSKSLAELTELADYLPAANADRPSDTLYDPAPARNPLYLGAGGFGGGTPAGGRATATDPADVLEIPTDNLGDDDPIVKRLRAGAVA